MVPPTGVISNSIFTDFDDVATDENVPSTDLILDVPNEIFDEMERWNELLKDRQLDLRGPRP